MLSLFSMLTILWKIWCDILYKILQNVYRIPGLGGKYINKVNHILKYCIIHGKKSKTIFCFEIDLKMLLSRLSSIVLWTFLINKSPKISVQKCFNY